MSMKIFNILKDDPFQIKQMLRDNFPSIKDKEIDLSRGEPFNPPDLAADTVFNGFFAYSIEVSKILGDKTLLLATDEDLQKAHVALQKGYSAIPTKLMDSALDLIIEKNQKYKKQIHKQKLLKQILSGVRGEDYTDIWGEEPIRAIVANKLEKFIASPPKEIFEPHEIILTIGASEAIGSIIEVFSTLHILESSSPSVAMVTPIYSPYQFILEKLGLIIHFIPTSPQKGYEPNEKALEEFKDRAKYIKLLILVNPGNPSSRVLSSDILKKLAEICYANNIIILTDTVYAPFILQPMQSILTYAPENTILIGSGSKFYQETGTRFGFVLITDAAEQNIVKIIGKDHIKANYGTESFREALVRAKGPDPKGIFFHTHFIPTPVQWMSAFRMLFGDADARKFLLELREKWSLIYQNLGLKSPQEEFPKALFVPYYALIDFQEICQAKRFDNLAKSMQNQSVTPEDLLIKLYTESDVLALPAATFFPEAPSENRWKMRFSVANQPLGKIKDATTKIIKMLKNWDSAI